MNFLPRNVSVRWVLETIEGDALVYLNHVATYSCCGIAIFEFTCPVSVAAIFTSPSVPAENRRVPSGLNERLRQLPLWRCVRHAVSMVP